MTVPAAHARSERLVDASVVTSVVDIAGVRHEVLPPRRTDVGALRVQAPSIAGSS